MKIEELLEYIIKTLVEQPKEVKINKEVNELGVLLTIQAAPNDIGAILGRNGSHINALRDLIRPIGLKNKSWVSIRLHLPENDVKPAPLKRETIKRETMRQPAAQPTVKKKSAQTVDDVIAGDLDDLKI